MKNILVVLLASLLLFSCQEAYSKQKNDDFAILEELVQQNNSATSVTSKISKQGNITSIYTDYYLRGFLREFEYIDSKNEQAFIQWVSHHQHNLPAVFYLEVASRLFPTNKEESVKWFMLGNIRVMYDLGRCMDPRAASGRRLYIDREMQVGKYTNENRKARLDGFRQALDIDKKNPYTASPIWICSHSMYAKSFDELDNPLPVSTEKIVLPKEQWPEILQAVHKQIQGYVDVLSKEFETQK